ncbi:MAG: hypothetical protein V1826_03185 [bacterium]
MMLQQASRWLWDNRKILITVTVFVAVLELMFYVPFYLIWWLLAELVVLSLGMWWLGGLNRQFARWLPLWGEVIWLTTGGVGLVVFNALGPWQFQMAAAVMVVILGSMLRFYDQYLRDETWPVQVFSMLNFLDILAFFFVTAALLSATDFYTFDLSILMVLLALQVIFAINLRFWRKKVTSARKWFYTLLTAMVAEEVLWVISSWHRGVYLKAFLLTIVFYVFSDFIMHYARGVLTVKVAVEYVGLVIGLLIAIFIFDWLFVLQ